MIARTRVTQADQLGAVAEMLASAEFVGLDIETTSLNPYDGEIRLIQLNIDDKHIYVIDLFQTRTAGPVEQALRDTKAVIVIHNAKFEQKWFLHKYKLVFWPVFCTYRSSALIHNGKEDLKHNLWAVETRELKIDHSQSKDMGPEGWSGVLTEEHWEYAANDVEHLLRLRLLLKPQLAHWGLLSTARLEFESIAAETSIELTGFYLNQEEWLKVADENKKRAASRADDLRSSLPHPTGQLALPGMLPDWNLNSTQQLLKSLHLLGKHTKNAALQGLGDTREMTLAVAAAEAPVLRKIIDFREPTKQVSGFGYSYLEHVSKHTNRVHTEFYAMLATGRYSSSNPNLQQIPRDKRFRHCFQAEPGFTLIAADYSGIEMRIVAEISGDPTLLAVFLKDVDPHKYTASVVMAKPIDEISKDERQLAKPVNFGLIYGMMEAKLVLYAASGYGVFMTERQASTYRNRYFDEFDGIARWHERVMRDGKRQGVSRTIGGRLRYLDPDTAWNEFKNTPVQGTGADALKVSLPLIYAGVQKMGSDCRGIVHIVHDEVILEVRNDPEVIARAKALLNESMTVAMQKYLKKVPVVVEPSDGPTWAAVK